VANVRASENGTRPFLTVISEPILLAANGRPEADYVIAVADADGSEPLLTPRADLVLRGPVLRSDLRPLIGQMARGERLVVQQAGRRTKVLPVYPRVKVLAADDTAVNREVLAEALSRFGIKPRLVANGAEALQCMREERFDLVLMDGSMPVVDGYEACRLQRQHERESGEPRTPIVNFTAHVVGEVATAWSQAGMDGVLHKPFTIDDLAQCLATWLGDGQAAAGSEAVEPKKEPVQDGDDLPLLRPSVLDEIAGMTGSVDGGFAARVFGLFQQHAPKSLDQIEEAARSGDLEQVAAAAHALKSMSHNIGAARAAECAADVEHTARSGALPAVEPLRDVLAQTLAALRDVARDQQGPGAPPQSAVA
jgi:CheY-like chemotaxis protein/HPt (histidine-containing phosphotransfer) domain-containing protein